MCIETAKQIREEIKFKLGYTGRQVSVRHEYCGYSSAVNITVKSLEIDLEPIEMIAGTHESIDRCEITHEILQGGNTFISTGYDWRLRHEDLKNEVKYIPLKKRAKNA